MTDQHNPGLFTIVPWYADSESFFQNRSLASSVRALAFCRYLAVNCTLKSGRSVKGGDKVFISYISALGWENPHYLHLQGWWLYNLAQQVIFSTQVDKDNSVMGK